MLSWSAARAWRVDGVSAVFASARAPRCSALEMGGAELGFFASGFCGAERCGLERCAATAARTYFACCCRDDPLRLPCSSELVVCLCACEGTAAPQPKQACFGGTGPRRPLATSLVEEEQIESCGHLPLAGSALILLLATRCVAAICVLSQQQWSILARQGQFQRRFAPSQSFHRGLADPSQTCECC